MALRPRDVPITRDDVAAWLKEYDKLKSKPKLRDHLLSKLEAKGLKDMEVSTPAHAEFSDVTPLVDMILDDLPSYGYNA